MHIPRATPVSTVAPISGVAASLHTIANLSWHVLLPYTLLGAGIMAYSQFKLFRGQRALKRDSLRASSLAKRRR